MMNSVKTETKYHQNIKKIMKKMMIISDDYKRQLEDALEFQDFICQQLYLKGICFVQFAAWKNQKEIGENSAGIEIKYDKRMKETGNIYIEIAEKMNASNKNYKLSGIYRDDNTFLYLVGDYDNVFIFTKSQLQRLYTEMENGTYVYKRITTPTSKGFLLPVEDVINLNLADKLNIVNHGNKL